jgi:hypothetical protein
MFLYIFHMNYFPYSMQSDTHSIQKQRKRETISVEWMNEWMNEWSIDWLIIARRPACMYKQYRNEGRDRFTGSTTYWLPLKKHRGSGRDETFSFLKLQCAYFFLTKFIKEIFRVQVERHSPRPTIIHSQACRIITW